MKRMKKIVSLALALIMALAMTTTAFAADNDPHKITIKQNSDDKTVHQYAAYQIFKGDLKQNSDFISYDTTPKVAPYILSNIEWGSGVDGDALLNDLKTKQLICEEAHEHKDSCYDSVFGNAFDNCTTAADVAKVLSEFSNTFQDESGALDYFARAAEKHLSSAYESATGTGDVVIDVVGSGYYLVKDITDSVEENGAYTRALLEVVGDSTMVVKSEVPSGDKQVYIDVTTNDDGTTTENLGDANNASIGSHVSYKITSKVPNWVGYNYYYFIMNDTLSEGLTFDGVENVTVVIKGVGENGADKTLSQGEDYYIYTGSDAAPKTFRLAFADIMQYTVGADIVVTYSATINDKAIIGTTGNPNTWNLQYSNNPDDTFDRDRNDDENKPGLPAEEDNEPLGQTPDEKTLTYVTELDITKYANEVADDHLLAGAEFTLTGISYQVVLSNVEYFRAPTSEEKGEYYLLLDGTYTKEEPKGTYYVEIGVGTAETTTGYIKVGEQFVVPDNKDDYIGETLYKLVKGTAEKYADVNTKYVKDTKRETTYVEVPVSIELTTGKEGKISFKDLGAGKYTLTETVTPEGFNTIEPIEFEIVFTAPERGVVTGEETCIWDLVSEDFEVTEGGNDNSLGGVFSANIINQSGSLLPSTGGIGTTIFYVVGGILVIGAGILLVAKKRMSNR